MRRWIGSTFVAATVVAMFACRDGGKDESAVALDTLAPTQTSLTTTTPTQVVVTPGAIATSEPGHYEGVTMRFDYGPDWYFWNGGYLSKQETVIIATIPPAHDGRGGLPDGVTKIDFYSSPEGFTSPYEPPAAPERVIPINETEFYLVAVEGEQFFWGLFGHVKNHGLDYQVSVYFITQRQPDTTEVENILRSWTTKAPAP